MRMRSQSEKRSITFHISDKYLQGITIGVVSDIEVDTNKLTRSGYLTPVVDFKHLHEVLVITREGRCRTGRGNTEKAK